MDVIKFSCDLDTNTPQLPLQLEITANNESKVKTLVDSKKSIEFDIPDEDGVTWDIKFIINGKTDKHTIRNSNGEIIRTSEIYINNMDISRRS